MKVGDKVEQVLKPVAYLYEKLFGKCHGCKKRKEYLNKLFDGNR